MSTQSRKPFIDSDFIVCSFKNGIKLIPPEKSHHHKCRLGLLMQSPFNVYFMDTASAWETLNDCTASYFNLAKKEDAYKKTVRDFVPERYASAAINNDGNIIGNKKLNIYVEDSGTDKFLSIKFPWYQENYLIGIFGIGIAMDSMDFAKSLLETIQSGLIQSYNQYSVNLTLREEEILPYYLEGQTAKSIGQILGNSPRTIEYHLENIRLKFGASNKIELIKKIRNYKK